MASRTRPGDRRWLRYTGFLRPGAGLRQERHAEALRAGGPRRREGDEARPPEGSGHRGRHLRAARQSEHQPVQANVELIQNTFVKAIFPRFDREVRGSGRSD